MEFAELLESLFNMNRYHSSPGMDAAINLLIHYYGGYREAIPDSMGTTWRIPPYYKVISADLVNSAGDVLASYDKNPLFLNAYSHSVCVSAPMADLKQYILYDVNRPDDFVFSFRRQYRHWEKGWGISLPYNVVSSICNDEILSVNIKTEFTDSPLSQFVLGSYQTDNNVLLVAHLDHPGQLNDGLSACLCVNEVFRRASPFLDTINLVCLNSVEIVGSVLHLKANKLNKNKVKFAVNVNGISIDSPLIACKSAVDSSTVFDMCVSLMKRLGLWNLNSILGFREGWGNDEIAFHVPGVEIPCASIYRSPFPAYHTSADNLESFSEAAFEDSVGFISSLLYVLDNNYLLEEVLFDHLPCLSSPELDLYLEPSLVSGLFNNSQLKDGLAKDSNYFQASEDLPEFLVKYSLKELDYIGRNKSFVNLFMNQLLSLMCQGVNCSIIELCCKLSSPPLFTINYLKRMQVKGLIRLSGAPRLR